MNTTDYSLLGKRTVNKVRRQFLNKTLADYNPEIIDTATRYITNHDVWIIASSIFNSTKERKNSTVVHFVNSHFNVDNISVGNHLHSKIVTLNFKVNQRNVIMPWEYMTKRLEAYNDIELLNMVKEFAKLYTGFTKALATDFGLLSPDNPHRDLEIRKIRTRAIRACREIESKYSFIKIEVVVNQDNATILSSSYNESLLKQLGYSVNHFSSWAKMNGMPTLFDVNNPGYQQIEKRFFEFFECSPLDGENLDLGPEIMVPLFDKENRKKEVGVRFVSILDLLPEGKFITAYIIIKSKKNEEEEEDKKENFYEGESTLDDVNYIKKNVKIEKGLGNCKEEQYYLELDHPKLKTAL